MKPKHEQDFDESIEALVSKIRDKIVGGVKKVARVVGKVVKVAEVMI